jgi:polyene macrolide polyketide synthase
LFEVVWRPVEVPVEPWWVGWADGSDGEVAGRAGVVVVDCAGRGVRWVLGVVQSWLGDDRWGGARLVVVTRRGVAVGVGDDVDVEQAAVWGLVRAAGAENPGRFQLVDLEVGEEVASVPVGEPEAAVRVGRVFVPRLTPVTGGGRPGVDLDPDGVVVITGGTGGLGAVVARYLVGRRGVRHVVLTSRRGIHAPGAVQLVAELAELGAQVRVVACDVSDRDAVHALVAGIVAERPLTGVVHAAGVADNGLVGSLTPQRVEAVWAAKAAGAWWLHEATAGLGLAAFVLFSSAGGLVLTAGQGNYAAANVYLDALAQHRHVNGLAGTAVAFGFWDVGAGMGRYLGAVDRQRMATQGLPVLDHQAGLDLFAQALDCGKAAVAALRVDTTALRARTDTIPALLRDLTPTHRPTATTHTTAGTDDAGELAKRLGGMSAADQHEHLLDLVRGQIAAVLGHASAAEIAPDRAFSELGFDSLTAVEFRNALGGLTGVRLPATLVFDYPSPNELAEHLRAEIAPTAVSGSQALLTDLERLAQTIGEIEVTEDVLEQIGGRLEILRARWTALRSTTDNGGETNQEFNFDEASDEDVFTLLDNQLGLSS